MYPSDQGEGANVPTLVRRLEGGEEESAPNSILLSAHYMSSDLIIKSTTACSMYNFVVAGEYGSNGAASAIFLESSSKAVKVGTYC